MTSPSAPALGRQAGDSLGAGLAIACAVQCIAVPVLLGLLPTTLAFAIPGVHLLRSPGPENVLVAASVLTGIAVLGHGRLRRHRSAQPLALFAAGCALLLLMRLLGEEQPVARLLPVAAAACLVMAHRRNTSCCRRAAAATGSGNVPVPMRVDAGGHGATAGAAHPNPNADAD